jgi:hypothetical protein
MITTIQKNFHEKIRPSKCFTMHSSKNGEQTIHRIRINVSDGISWKFRIAKIAFTFTAEALAIGETLEIIGKIDLDQNFVIFSDSKSMLKEINNTSTMNNTLHITQMLKDKIERPELRGGKKQFYWIPGHCGVEVNEIADLEAKQSIIEGRDSQLLLPVADLKVQWKKKGKEKLHSLSKHQKGQRRKLL